MSRVLFGILLFCQRLHLINVLFSVFYLKKKKISARMIKSQCIAHLYCHAKIKGALSHFRILLSILLIILNNLQVIQVLAAK